MKLIFSVVLLAGVLNVASAYEPEKLAKFKKLREDVETAHKECDADPATKIEPASVDRLKAGTATDEDKLAFDKNELCGNVKLGVQKPNGDYEIENLRKRLDAGGVDEAKIDEVIATCGTRPNGTSAERAAGIYSICVIDKLSQI